MDYSSFLTTKLLNVPEVGFDCGTDINPKLFAFQRDTVRWACRRGRAAVWWDCGLGKTPMQLEWARHVCRHTGGNVLVLTPLAVAPQTIREGAKFGIEVHSCRSKADVKPGISVTNYEMLKHFNTAAFSGVVLDESSILKSYMGKTKQALVEAFSETPYRLCCTATPSPNDHLELGNHSQFLGVMDSNEMISRWFINDTMAAGSYRLKGHAAREYWDWVASWAICLERPSDLGYDDAGFVLPPLNIHGHVVSVDATAGAAAGLLFRDGDMSATSIHREMRLTVGERARRVADLVNGNRDYWLVWCNTDYEADALNELIPDAVEVRGSEKPEAKEQKLDAFSRGETRVMVTKPRIAGFGMNWQHCCNVAFVGLSYSYEQYYQAIRRTWRFGQKRPVECHVVSAATEGAVTATIREKELQHHELKIAMIGAMRKTQLQASSGLRLREDCGTKGITVPSWMRRKSA